MAFVADGPKEVRLTELRQDSNGANFRGIRFPQIPLMTAAHFAGGSVGFESGGGGGRHRESGNETVKRLEAQEV